MNLNVYVQQDILSWDEVQRIGAQMTATLDDPGLLRPSDAAALLGVSTATVKRLAREGKLPAVKVGAQWRFSLGALNYALRSTPLRGHGPASDRRPS